MFKKNRLIEILTISLTTILSIVAICVSYKACDVSEKSLSVAEGVRKDNRKIAQLDLEPEINIKANFRGIKGSPPYFVISNTGPIDAIQIVVEFISHRYDSSKDRVISLYGTDQEWSIAGLKPLESKTFQISEHFLMVNARIQTPLENNVIEARVSYRKNPDKKLFVKRAFYFINSNGTWVSENSGSITEEKYSKIKKAMLSRVIKTDHLPFYAPLHDVNLNEIEHNR